MEQGEVREVQEWVQRESAAIETLLTEVRKVIVGQRYLLDRMLIGLEEARKAGVTVELKGSGSAIDQSLAPGLTSNPGVIQVRFTTSDHAFADLGRQVPAGP